MQSFLVISKDKNKARQYTLDFAKEQKISNFDVFTLETEKTLGIADVKALSNQIFLRPLKGDKKAVVVEAFLGATTEAQNAFLKILEEPPLSTYIFILAGENYFLATINSRTKLFELDKGVVLTKQNQIDFAQVFENLEINGTGYRLKLAQDLSKDKIEALAFLENFIAFTRDKMVGAVSAGSQTNASQYKNMIEIVQKYYKEIKQSNVNLRLGLENLFLEI